MPSDLGLASRSQIYSKPGALLHASSKTPSVTDSLSSNFWIYTPSPSIKLGKALSRAVPLWRTDCAMPGLLAQQNLTVLNRPHIMPSFRKSVALGRCNICKRTLAAAGHSIGRLAGAEVTGQFIEKDGLDSDGNDPGTEEKKRSNSSVVEEVAEFQLSGDETEMQEIGYSFISFATLNRLIIKIRDVGKQFVLNNIGGVTGLLRIGQSQPEPKVLELHTSGYAKKDGVSALHQWTATELTMQHDQLTRIAIDINYLVFAFAFFGWVRILEAILAVFSTHPPAFRKLMQAFNAIDYLTIAWLACNLRRPIIGILQVDPNDLERVATFKAQVWVDLHAFFERQWKVMATVAMARFLGVIATNIPPSHWVTKNIKIIWDMMMALPVF